MVKKFIYSIVIVFSAALIMSACSPKIPFTAELHSKLVRDSVDMGKVQFYNSDEIILQRESYRDEEVNVKKGQIRFENGKFEETIIIKRHTPGICVMDTTMSLKVSFESEGELQFGRVQDDKVIPYYKLYALDWDEGVGVLRYNDSVYFTQEGAGSSHLLVKKSQVYSLMKEKRVAKGRKVRK